METKHTPGPWRISTANPFAVNTSEAGIATAHGIDAANYSEFFPSTEQAKANARLIAAAPELLEALLALEEVDGFKGWHHTYDEACAKARAAIAKATGNTI